MCKYKLLIAIGIIISSVVYETNGYNYVDAVRNKYLSKERDLWKRIEIEPNRTALLELIYSIHDDRDFIDNRVYDKYYDFISAIDSVTVRGDLITLNAYYQEIKNYMANKYQPANIINEISLQIKNIYPDIKKRIVSIYAEMLLGGLMSKTVAKIMETPCHNQVTEQQIIYEIYKHFEFAQLRVYALIQMTFMLRTVYNFDDLKQESNIFREEFAKKTDRWKYSIKESLALSDNMLWRCDLQHNFAQYTTKLTRLVQGYVDNEVNLNVWDTCRFTCSDYTRTMNYGCHEDTLCNKQKSVRQCKGDIYDCQHISNDATIAFSNEWETRRYEYIQFSNDKIFGNKTKSNHVIDEASSWIRGFYSCHTCFCICDEPSIKSDRHFNLRDVVVNTRRNMIVTGVNIFKINGLISLGVQQGRLEQFGYVNNTNNTVTFDWIAADDFQLFDDNVKEGVDYFTMDYNRRAINLDDIICPPQYVITGVRFGLDKFSRITLEAQITKFDYLTGTLYLDTTRWIRNEITDRTEFELVNPDVSIRSKERSVIDTKSGQYIKFTHSSLELDAGQETVPYFDVQHTYSKIMGPLSGIGLYHKGKLGYGGYIAIRIFTLNLKDYFQS